MLSCSTWQLQIKTKLFISAVTSRTTVTSGRPGALHTLILKGVWARNRRESKQPSDRHSAALITTITAQKHHKYVETLQSRAGIKPSIWTLVLHLRTRLKYLYFTVVFSLNATFSTSTYRHLRGKYCIFECSKVWFKR